MYSPIEIEDVEYQLKPMNCPFHITIYNSKLRSYRELPLRFAELGTVYRFERSGVLHGLMRVRGFTQDDAHLFCRPDQLDAEIVRVLDFVTSMLAAFGFTEYETYLSTKPDNAAGTDEQWEIATAALKRALETRGHRRTRSIPGEGVFYGPKIDIKIKDSLDRAWQCSTIQVDFNNPNRFELEYIGEDGKAHQPVMLHRALLGSIERFFGVLIEHYAGAFPLWLAPMQAVVIPVTEKHHEYAAQVAARAAGRGRARPRGRPQREARTTRSARPSCRRFPTCWWSGDKEVEAQNVSVRHRQAGDLGSIGRPRPWPRRSASSRPSERRSKRPRPAPGGVS